MRSVEVHDQPVERAEAGQRVAASLVGVERARDPARLDARRRPGALPESYRLDVELHALPGGPGRRATARSCRCSPAPPCVEARVALLGAERLAGRARPASPSCGCASSSRRRAATA